MSSLRTIAGRPACRLLSTAARLQTGGSARHGNDPEVLERGKQSILQKHSKDSKEAPHWHEELASDSEAFIKAYRGEVDASAVEIAKLQNATKKDIADKNK